jgi:hypothetical protein
MTKLGLDQFYSDAAAGTLPQVSYIIGPMELSEHPPYMPKDGAWLQRQVAEAVINSPKYNSTVLMISYDGKCLSLTVLVYAYSWKQQKLVGSVIMWYHITRHLVLWVNGWRIHMMILEMYIRVRVSVFGCLGGSAVD